MSVADEFNKVARRLREQAERLRSSDGDNALVDELQEVAKQFDCSLLSQVDLDSDEAKWLEDVRELLHRLDQHHELPDRLNEQTERLYQVRDQHHRIVEDLEGRLEQSEEAQRAQQAELDQLRQAAGSDRSALSEATAHMADLEGQRNDAKQRETDLQHQIADRDERIKELRSQLSEANRQADEQRKQAETADDQARQARQDLTALKEDLPRRLESARKAGRRDAKRDAKRARRGKPDTSTEGRSKTSSDENSVSSRHSGAGAFAGLLVVLSAFVGLVVLLVYNIVFQATDWQTALVVVGTVTAAVGMALGLTVGERSLLLRVPLTLVVGLVTGSIIGLGLFVLEFEDPGVLELVFAGVIVVATVTLAGWSAATDGLWPGWVLLALLHFGGASLVVGWWENPQVGDCVEVAEFPVLGVVPLRAPFGSGGCGTDAFEVAGVSGEAGCRQQGAAYLGVQREGVELHSGGRIGAALPEGRVCLVHHPDEGGRIGPALLQEEVDEARCLGPSRAGTDLGQPPCEDYRARLVQLPGSTDPPADGHWSAIATAEACRRATASDRDAVVGRVVDDRLLCGVALPGL